MKGYIKLRKKGLEILNSELSKKLFYHGIHHTQDVYHVVNLYIEREGIESHEAKLLRIGALFHDIGYTVSSENHEEKGVEIATKYMIEYGFSTKDIRVVKGLIMATKIPQSPKNHLEEIICDADLDYLGRSDFHPISKQLFEELKAFSVINTLDEWNQAQLKFLETHQYHTKFARKNRSPKKAKRIQEIKAMISDAGLS
jgi:putative nucleotidyltransferase with HDIG domain